MWEIGFASFFFLERFLDLLRVRWMVVVASAVRDDFSVRNAAPSPASLFLLLSERSSTFKSPQDWKSSHRYLE